MQTFDFQDQGSFLISAVQARNTQTLYQPRCLWNGCMDLFWQLILTLLTLRVFYLSCIFIFWSVSFLVFSFYLDIHQYIIDF